MASSSTTGTDSYTNVRNAFPTNFKRSPTPGSFSTRIRERLRNSLPPNSLRTFPDSSAHGTKSNDIYPPLTLGKPPAPEELRDSRIPMGNNVPKFSYYNGTNQSTLRWKNVSTRLLRDCIPIRSELNFQHPRADYEDTFFELYFERLFLKLHAFARQVFGQSSQSFIGHSIWKWHSLSPQFRSYAELVVLGDQMVNSWAGLLERGEDRLLLVQAVVMKVIALNIFPQLLFGANASEIKLLENQDREFLDKDGYERTKLRSHTVRMILDHSHGQPVGFWRAVDRIATQTTNLLLPLINMVGKLDPEGVPHLPEIHQEVHEIVALAGWLAVCIRWSPTIIRIDWLIPGDSYLANQVNIAPEIFKRSRKIAENWDNNNLITKNVKTPLRIARIKISVIPSVKRFTPGCSLKGEPHGQRIYTIVKPHVAYYYGLMDGIADRKGRETLDNYMKLTRPFYIRTHAILFTLIIVLIVLGIITNKRFPIFQMHVSEMGTHQQRAFLMEILSMGNFSAFRGFISSAHLFFNPSSLLMIALSQVTKSTLEVLGSLSNAATSHP